MELKPIGMRNIYLFYYFIYKWNIEKIYTYKENDYILQIINEGLINYSI